MNQRKKKLKQRFNFLKQRVVFSIFYYLKMSRMNFYLVLFLFLFDRYYDKSVFVIIFAIVFAIYLLTIILNLAYGLFRF